MFHQVKPQSTFQAVTASLEVVFHMTVSSVRGGHSSPFVALLVSIMQTATLVIIFYTLYAVFGLRSSLIRGDFLMYILSGIFLYLTHIKVIAGVMGAENSTSPMMQHAPMNTLVAICSKALSSLYTQTLAIIVIVFVYHVLAGPISIADPIGAFSMFLLAWFSGCAIGLVFYAVRPWAPTFMQMFSQVYRRANMVASGKMFLANTLPPIMLNMFDWNPLFHCIDQARGFAFNNYFPRNSNWEYPLYFGLAMAALGLIGAFYTRQYASASWSVKTR